MFTSKHIFVKLSYSNSKIKRTSMVPYSVNEICTSIHSMSSNRIERENESCSAVIHFNNDTKRNELHHMADVEHYRRPCTTCDLATTTKSVQTADV